MKNSTLLFLFLPFFAFKTTPPVPRPAKDLAIFFAVDSYKKGTSLGNLQNPIKNATQIAAELKNRFGFDTLVRRNPTQAQIIEQLQDLERRYARNEDGQHPADGQLFLFFSGHGLSEDENGYFLPADADPAKPYEKGIAYEIWRPKLSKINCRHILVAIDACYSVRFDPDWKNRPDGEFKRPGELTDTQRALANYETYKARVFFTSDNKEDQTPDRSNFAKKLLEGLRSGTTTDGFLTSKQLFANFVEGATPTPRAGTFGDDEPSAAFLFYEQKKNAPPSAADQDKALWKQTQTENTLAAYRKYLRDCKLCLYTEDAEAAILRGTPAPTSPKTDEKAGKTVTPSEPQDPFGLVKVPGGTFKMGCTTEQQDCDGDEKPAHEVTVPDFYIGKYEVTQALWTEIMGDNPSSFKNCDQCPVENVSWDDVQAFLKKLNEKYPRRNYRLPTEAEWEYAARGGGKAVLFGNGKNVIDPKDINFDASDAYKKSYSVVGEYRAKTVPVGSLKSPNALGLHDMSGNVWEWCEDDWHGDYKGAPSSGGAWVDSPRGSYRVLRGGSWYATPLDCRVSLRLNDAPGDRAIPIGFRLCSSPQ